MARRFQDLEIFRLSYNIAIRFYRITEKFPENEANNLTSQIRRASVSIPLNIAEGCSRYTKKEFLQFLKYSYGSVKELQVLLMFCRDFKYINNEEYLVLYEELDKLGSKLFVFMRKVNDEGWKEWFKR
jgi:four helix bundle protein